MDQEEFDRVAASFAAFHAHFASLFGRKEAQRRSEQYVRGLLVHQTDRRNAENVAETIAGATPRALQRLLTAAPWPTEPVIERLAPKRAIWKRYNACARLSAQSSSETPTFSASTSFASLVMGHGDD
jgi:hypothetical protein